MSFGGLVTNPMTLTHILMQHCKIDIFTWLSVLAAQEPDFIVTTFIVPPMSGLHIQTVFGIVGVVWFSCRPRCEFPGPVVCPRPYTLLMYVGASYPDLVQAFYVHSLHDIFLDGIRGDRGQMAALIHAELLSISPVLLGGAPHVAVFSILLPALSTGCNVQVLVLY